MDEQNEANKETYRQTHRKAEERRPAEKTKTNMATETDRVE